MPTRDGCNSLLPSGMSKVKGQLCQLSPLSEVSFRLGTESRYEERRAKGKSPNCVLVKVHIQKRFRKHSALSLSWRFTIFRHFSFFVRLACRMFLFGNFVQGLLRPYDSVVRLFDVS